MEGIAAYTFVGRKMVAKRGCVFMERNHGPGKRHSLFKNAQTESKQVTYNILCERVTYTVTGHIVWKVKRASTGKSSSDDGLEDSMTEGDDCSSGTLNFTSQHQPSEMPQYPSRQHYDAAQGLATLCHVSTRHREAEQLAQQRQQEAWKAYHRQEQQRQATSRQEATRRQEAEQHQQRQREKYAADRRRREAEQEATHCDAVQGQQEFLKAAGLPPLPQTEAAKKLFLKRRRLTKRKLHSSVIVARAFMERVRAKRFEVVIVFML